MLAWVWGALMIFGLAKHWYATPVSPVVLLMSPGAFIGLLNPQEFAAYFVTAFLVQAFVTQLRHCLFELHGGVPRRQGYDAV